MKLVFNIDNLLIRLKIMLFLLRYGKHRRWAKKPRVFNPPHHHYRTRLRGWQYELDAMCGVFSNSEAAIKRQFGLWILIQSTTPRSSINGFRLRSSVLVGT